MQTAMRNLQKDQQLVDLINLQSGHASYQCRYVMFTRKKL